MGRAQVAARNRRGDTIEYERRQFPPLRQLFHDNQIANRSVLLLGNIGSHVNITSGWRGTSSEKRSPSQHPRYFQRAQALAILATSDVTGVSQE